MHLLYFCLDSFPPDSQQNPQKPQGKYIPPNEIKYAPALDLTLCFFFMKQCLGDLCVREAGGGSQR